MVGGLFCRVGDALGVIHRNDAIHVSCGASRKANCLPELLWKQDAIWQDAYKGELVGSLDGDNQNKMLGIKKTKC